MLAQTAHKTNTVSALQTPISPGNYAHVSEQISSQLFNTLFFKDYGVYWAQFLPHCPKTFTFDLISSLRQGQMDVERQVRQGLKIDQTDRIRYQVISSAIPKVFNLGGDLELFIRCIRDNDRDTLRKYAESCVDVVYTNAVNYQLPLVTISLVQGSALGGGFEAALANNVVIAERQCQMGLPEIMFNMFPGMGAYQLLSRRVGPHKAEQIILSGRTYSAAEMHAMGVVDVLAEEGEGEEAVWNYIRRNHNKMNGRNAFRKAISEVDPLEYDGFVKMIDTWVDAAFDLTETDIKTMGYLLRAQARGD